MTKVIKSDNVPKSMQAIYDKIITVTDAVAKEYLNEEYGQLIRHATAALCRKRPSPLLQGRVNSWACGITYAMGFVNFLFDRSQEPSMNATDLCAAFGVSKGTGSAKSKEVRDLLGTYQLDPNWCLPSKMDKNFKAWMIMVNGFIIDARYAPRDIQEAAYAKGLIPYIPEEPSVIED